MFKRILVAVDGSATGRNAFNVALGLASETGARLQPYFVIESPPTYFDAPGYDASILLDQLTAEARELAQQCNSAMREKGITGKFAAYEASIAEDVPAVLLKAADAFGADLIITGTHGRRGFQRLLLGSVAERCVRQSTRPVLLVPLVKPEAAGTEPSV